MYKQFSAKINVVDHEPSSHQAVMIGCPANAPTSLIALAFLISEWEHREGFDKDIEERCHEDRASFFYSSFIHGNAKMHLYGDTDFLVEDIKEMSDEEYQALQVVQDHFEYKSYDFDVLVNLYRYINSDEFDEHLFYVEFYNPLKESYPLLAQVSEYLLDLKHEGIYELTEECMEGLLEHIDVGSENTEETDQ